MKVVHMARFASLIVAVFFSLTLSAEADQIVIRRATDGGLFGYGGPVWQEMTGFINAATARQIVSSTP
jgi:hypothetical protein